MKSRIVLTADDGKVLTNGSVYGTVIYLAESSNVNEYYEITNEEYEKKMEEELKKFLAE